MANPTPHMKPVALTACVLLAACRGIGPDDAPGYVVTITRGGTTRTITWSLDSDLDPSVRRFVAATRLVAGLGGS